MLLAVILSFLGLIVTRLCCMCAQAGGEKFMFRGYVCHTESRTSWWYDPARV
jgi:hypothetical protein